MATVFFTGFPGFLGVALLPHVLDPREADRDLEGTGITVPRFESYVGNMVDFVKAHPEIGAKAMV